MKRVPYKTYPVNRGFGFAAYSVSISIKQKQFIFIFGVCPDLTFIHVFCLKWQTSKCLRKHISYHNLELIGSYLIHVRTHVFLYQSDHWYTRSGGVIIIIIIIIIVALSWIARRPLLVMFVRLSVCKGSFYTCHGIGYNFPHTIRWSYTCSFCFQFHRVPFKAIIIFSNSFCICKIFLLCRFYLSQRTIIST